MVKMTLIGFFTDSRCRPVRTYLKDHDMIFLERSVRRVINGNERLKHILVADRRKEAALAAEAHAIILQHYRVAENEENTSSSSVQAAESPAKVDPPSVPTIFDFRRLKEIVKELDFDKPQRMK